MSQHIKGNRITNSRRTPFTKDISRVDWLIGYLNTQNKLLFPFLLLYRGELSWTQREQDSSLKCAHVLDKVVRDCLHATACKRRKIE